MATLPCHQNTNPRLLQICISPYLNIWYGLLHFAFASIYVLAQHECSTALLKYMHTIRLGANRAKALDWKDYDIQFRLKKRMFYKYVICCCWLRVVAFIYVQSPTCSRVCDTNHLYRCNEFNYKDQCNKNISAFVFFKSPLYQVQKRFSFWFNFQANSVSTSWRPSIT